MDSFELNKVMAFTFMSYFTSVLQPMVGEFKRKLQRFVLMCSMLAELFNNSANPSSCATVVGPEISQQKFPPPTHHQHKLFQNFGIFIHFKIYRCQIRRWHNFFNRGKYISLRSAVSGVDGIARKSLVWVLSVLGVVGINKTEVKV